MNSNHQATRISTLGASAILALTCATACGQGSSVERDRGPVTQLEVTGTDSHRCPPLTAFVELRRSPPTTCDGHPSHPTWAEYRLLQQGW